MESRVQFADHVALQDRVRRRLRSSPMCCCEKLLAVCAADLPSCDEYRIGVAQEQNRVSCPTLYVPVLHEQKNVTADASRAPLRSAVLAARHKDNSNQPRPGHLKLSGFRRITVTE